MPTYSPKAARALGYLKQSYNDVEIYVEDTSCQNMWLAVLRSLLPANVKLSSVNMLGGRDNVVSACKLDQKNDLRRKLYIIDADFDLILGKKKPKLKHLHRIKAYCIENLLISEQSLARLCFESMPDTNEADIANVLDFKNAEQSIRRDLLPLFILYATCMDLAPEVKTVSYSVNKLFVATPGGPVLDKNKIISRMIAVSRSGSTVAGRAEFIKRMRELKEASRNRPIQQLVSGKDYLWPLWNIRLAKLAGYKGGPAQLKVSLATHYTRSADPWFARRVGGL